MEKENILDTLFLRLPKTKNGFCPTTKFESPPPAKHPSLKIFVNPNLALAPFLNPILCK